MTLMAALGAWLRFGLDRALPTAPNSFPWGILTCNVLGSFAIGALHPLGARFLDPQLKVAIITGLLGSFTTFSAFSLQSLQLLQAGRWPLMLIYAFSSVGLGLAAAYGGHSLLRLLMGGSNL